MTNLRQRMARLLLVEDDRQNYEMMTRRLERRGYDVELATDGEAAVEKARVHLPDLILMDIKLPKLDGYEATRRIRQFDENSNVPIIALTAHALTEDEQKAKEAGCNDYHAKPVAFDQLINQMEALLDRDAAHGDKHVETTF